MTAIYVDTSAVGRVLLGESTAPAIVRALDTFDENVASRLLRVELRRLASRHDLLETAAELLDTIALVPLDERVLDAAETVQPASIGTLDAVHLVTAVRLAEAGLLDTVLTYDARLADGARLHGLTVLSPVR